MPLSIETRPARLLAVVMALIAVAGCVSVSPPTPSPTAVPAQPTSTPTATPAAASPSASAGPTPTGQPSPATTPDGTDDPSASPGPQTPGATVEPELAQQIDAVTATIPAIRQLDALDDVPYEFITREDFRDNLLETVFEDTPQEFIEAEERLLKRLGLIPAEESLLDLIVELYGASVAAYYQPDNGRFYIIRRDAPFGPLDKLTVAHEYTHALQDQHFDLEGSRIKDLTAGDAILGQLAAIEGDATLTSQQWMITGLTDAEKIQLLTDSLGELDENVLADMPLILRRQLEFPYVEGFQFVDQIWRLGGYEAVDQLLETPPASTEQILHIDKYYAGEQPVEVELDDLSAELGDGWSRTYEQTIGELGVQVFAGGGETPPVNIPGLPVEWPRAEVAAGWGGDRLNMYENGDQWAIVWETAWDTQADMNEFATRAGELLLGLDAFAGSAPGDAASNRYEIWLASDQATLDSISAAAE